MKLHKYVLIQDGKPVATVQAETAAEAVGQMAYYYRINSQDCRCEVRKAKRGDKIGGKP